MTERQSIYRRGGELAPDRSFSNKWVTGSAILLLLLVLATYSGAFQNGFVGWDDREYVIDNPLVRSGEESHLGEIFSTVVSLNYHPLTILSLRLNNNVCTSCQDGISAGPFILTNILLHTLNTLLVFALIYLLFQSNLFLAFFVAALFAVHPMHVESVAWISARKDVLSGFFFLSALLGWFQYLQSKPRRFLWLSVAFVLFVMACLSKATAVVFPVAALLVRYVTMVTGEGNSLKLTVSRLFSREVVLALLPFFAVSLFFGVVALHLQNGENFMGLFRFSKAPDSVINIVAPFSWLQRFQVASYGFWVYLIKFFVPVNQSCFYPYPEGTGMTQGSFPILLWLALLGFVMLLLLVGWTMKRTKLFAFGFGFFLVTLLLVLQFIAVGKAILAERYSYLPYIGLSVVPVWYVVQNRSKYANWLLLPMGCFVFGMSILAHEQVKVWRDTDTLWSQSIRNHPDQELAWRARGKYFYGLSAQAGNKVVRKNLEDKAMADFRVAIEHKTASADVYEGLGMILLGRGEAKSALKLMNLAISLNPANGRLYYNRAILYDQMNLKQEAIHDYDLAIARDPGSGLEIMRNRSALYLETSQFEKALRDCNALVQLEGNNFYHYYNRAYAKVMLRDYEGAIADYQIVLRLNPGDRQTLEQLNQLKALKTKGNTE